MKPSPTQNLTSSSGKPYALVYVGNLLWFGSNVQKMYKVTRIEKSRTYSDDIDLTELQQITKILPIVFENE